MITKTRFFTFLITVFLMSGNMCMAKKFEIPKDNETITTYNQALESTLNPTSIKVLVWNMYKAGKSSWKKDFQNIINGFDILVLQESYKSDLMVNTYKEDLEHQYIMASSFNYVKKDMKIGTGVLTASNTKAQDISWMRTKYKEVFFTTPKVALLIKYNIEGSNKQLLVANIHAINAVPAFVLKSQLKQIAKKIAQHNGPVIWAGDFNTWSKTKQKLMYKIMKKLGLKEVSFLASNDDRMEVFKKKIDFIFYKGLVYENPIVYGNIKGSDHKAMSAEFRLLH